MSKTTSLVLIIFDGTFEHDDFNNFWGYVEQT
jgi:hypothetical protein